VSVCLLLARAVLKHPGSKESTMRMAKKILKWTGIALAGALVALTITVVVMERRTYDVGYPDVHASADPAVIARGKYLVFGPAHCVECHGDLYALGAVGYCLLTGTPPFQAATLLELCSQRLHVTPERPSQRLGRAVPEQLEELILACLAKRPEARPASAAELSRALGACSDVVPWTDADAARWWARSGG
jgi:hypothetical protein